MTRNFKPRKCEVCGKEFTPVREGHLSCSKKCSFKRWQIKNDTAFNHDMRKCVICGTEFKPRNTRHICCSDKCTKKRNKMVSSVSAKQKYAREKEKRKAKEAMPVSNHDKIASITCEGWDKERLSYGQYVAKYGL